MRNMIWARRRVRCFYTAFSLKAQKLKFFTNLHCAGRGRTVLINTTGLTKEDTCKWTHQWALIRPTRSSKTVINLLGIHLYYAVCFATPRQADSAVWGGRANGSANVSIDPKQRRFAPKNLYGDAIAHRRWNARTCCTERFINSLPFPITAWECFRCHKN